MDRVIAGLCEHFQKERSLRALPLDELFESFCAYCVISTLYEDEFDPEEFRIGSGGDLGIDAAAILVNGDLLIDAADVRSAINSARSIEVKIVVVQAKSATNFDAKVITDLADNLIEIFDEEEISYPSSSGIQNLKQCIDEIYRDIGKLKSLPELKVFYATTGKVVGDSHIEAKRTKAISQLDQTNYFSQVEWQLLGARELRELYQRATSAITVDFSMPKKLPLPKIPGVEQAFLGVLPAKELVRIITDAGGGVRKSLFYENVRDFQDYNPVNLEIQKTLRDTDRKDRFAVLNNGVTIVAREIRSAGEDLHLQDFQIVNGCQTCHVLFDEQDELGDGVWVPVKLIESRDEDVVAGITAATNRQTAVSDEDLAAQERFHKELEATFISFPESERLYYERRARQYSSQQGLEKTRIVTRSQLTRAYASMFLDEPSRAGRYYKELRESRRQDLFKEGQSAYAYYTSAVAAYRIDWLLRNRKIDRTWAPAKYQFLMALKILIIGGKPLPSSPRQAEKECKKILDVVWDVNASESAVEMLFPAITAAASKDGGRAELNRDTVRTQRFTENLRAEVLKLSPSFDLNALKKK